MEKIPNAELCRVADEDADEKLSVLIELELPAQQVEFVKREKRGTSGYSPHRVAPETPELQEENARKINAATEFLAELLGTAPLWLQSARAFVATVTPKQLRAIARSPLTKAIQPNRRLEVTR